MSPDRNKSLRYALAVIPALFLAACGSDVIDDRSGVGFGNYDEYLAEQERKAEARRAGVAPGMVVSPESSVNANVAIGTPSQVIAEPVAAAEPENVVVAESVDVAETTPSQPVVDPDNPEISDEQNFEAVSARETIESDRERLERQREQYVVIEPGALPRRRGGDQANIVAFALSTQHPVGQRVWSRGPFKNANATARNCRRYLSPDLAQEAFLNSGGPERDPKRLDPDGDGYACAWDPSPFRVIRN